MLWFAESVYTFTDPPIKFFRRFIPPLRLGGVALDLSFIVLFFAVQILQSIAIAYLWSDLKLFTKKLFIKLLVS